MIDIVPYKAEWPAAFEALAGELRSALGPLAPRIDHIGSTAVPGLAAKDRIDIQVGVKSLGELPAVTEALVGRGFRSWPSIGGDHVPPRGPADAREWAKGFFQTALGAVPAANIHVREVGRANWRYALLCRDFLRADREAAEAYARLKTELARHVGDIDVYSDIKDPAVDLIMVAAELWATSSGWAPDRAPEAATV